MRKGAPLSEWRTTNTSASIASRLAMVSSRLSPLLVLERWMSRLNTSADRRCAGDLEGGAGAGAVLEEQVEHALAAQQRHFFHFAAAEADKTLRGVEDVREHVARQPSG
jgi:hypothetical protein